MTENPFEQPKIPDATPATPEEEELYAYFMEQRLKEAPPEHVRESESGVTEFEELCDDFERKFDVQALLAITTLEAKDAEHHPLRHPAKLALVPILSKLQELGRGNIVRDRYNELDERYNRLSRAVGFINHGTVRHT